VNVNSIKAKKSRDVDGRPPGIKTHKPERL